MSLFVISDLHLGAIRTGGTTPATALQLRKNLLDGFCRLVGMAHKSDLIINGDLFDTHNVPLVDLFQALTIAQTWLLLNPDRQLWLPPGNHDLSKNSETFSSFDFFSRFLQTNHPSQVVVPREGRSMLLGMNGYVIPHMPNQDLFELELAKVPPCDYLFLHCNYDNGFAAKSDHSLNLSREAAEKCLAKRIVIGHEHQAKQDLYDKVIVVGNQLPSSVADCLGNDVKQAFRVTGADTAEWIPVWKAEGSFVEIDWLQLLDGMLVAGPWEFIRIVGSATTAQASDVVNAISKFRQSSPALVITNAVAIEGMDLTQAATSLEEVKAFNVWQELLAFLDDDMRATVIKLMEKT